MKQPNRSRYWFKRVPSKLRAVNAPSGDLAEYDFDIGYEYVFDDEGPACWICYDWQECTCPVLPEPGPLRVSFGELFHSTRVDPQRGAS